MKTYEIVLSMRPGPEYRIDRFESLGELVELAREGPRRPCALYFQGRRPLAAMYCHELKLREVFVARDQRAVVPDADRLVFLDPVESLDETNALAQATAIMAVNWIESVEPRCPPIVDVVFWSEGEAVSCRAAVPEAAWAKSVPWEPLNDGPPAKRPEPRRVLRALLDAAGELLGENGRR